MPTKTRNRPPQGEKVCVNCQKKKKLINFYQAINTLISNDGKTVNVCKQCIKAESISSDGSLNEQGFKHMLQLMDRAFVPSILEGAINETTIAFKTNKGRRDLVGNYIKSLNVAQYAKMSFLDSMNMLTRGQSVVESLQKEKSPSPTSDDAPIEFEVTEDDRELFGEGFPDNEYVLMRKKYEKLKKNYTIQTNLHEEALATYVRFKVKEELATAEGHVQSADKWNSAANKAAEQAKLTPKQLTQSDLQGGINSFSDIFKAVEQAVDVIPILPQFKQRPNDVLDFTIWCYVNYARNLQGMPECGYEDVYKFYDRLKAEYITQHGDPFNLLAEDSSMQHRETIKQFITLPTDYNSGE